MGGAHGHADALNVEWMWKNQLFFTDTGRYTYEEGEWRRYFKSTRAHNTVTVDGLDQTPYLSTQQWGEPEAQATALRWESNDSYHFIDASQDGYTHLPDPVTHRRWMLAGARNSYIINCRLAGGRCRAYAGATFSPSSASGYYTGNE
ncbi:heparinase II/III-family protein [Paenibacillus amylolyticus]|nr:heparinase II/III-family protein [Paenibacillus amylolyticus]